MRPRSLKCQPHLSTALSGCRLLAFLLVISAGGNFLFQVPAAARSLAGSRIYNQSAATFTWNRIPFQVTSNQVSTEVLGVYSFEIMPGGTVDQPAHRKRVAPGSTAYLPYILTNTGNIPDRYQLSLPSIPGEVDDFIPAGLAFHHDLNANGMLDPGEDIMGNTTPRVGPGESIHLLVRIDVPVTITAGARLTRDLVGASLGDPGLAEEDQHVFQLTATDRATLRLVKRPSVSITSPGNTITYFMEAVNLGGGSAYGRPVAVDGIERAGLLIQSAIPEQAGAGTEYVSGSLRCGPAGQLQIFSTDTGESWSEVEPSDPADITNIGCLIGTEIVPGQSIKLEFEVQISRKRGEGALRSEGDLTYAAAVDGRELVEKADTQVQITAQADQLKVFIGPKNDPRAAVDGDTNADFTLAPGLGPANPEAGLPANAEVAGNWVNFHNTVENAGGKADTINIEIDSARSNLPDAWTVMLMRKDGLTPINDSNGDGYRDVGSLAPGEESTITVRIHIPADAEPGDNDGAGFRNAVRAFPAASPSAYNLTSNIIAHVAAAGQVWVPVRKRQRVDAEPMPGDPITYTLEFGNQSSESLTNIVITDEISDGLVDIRNLTQGQVTDRNGSSATIEVEGKYANSEETAGSGEAVWNIPEVPPGFRGQVSFKASFAEDLSPGTEIENDFLIRSDETQDAQRSNTVSVAVGGADALMIEKNASESTVEIGDLILYTLTISNAGVTPLKEVTVSDILPRGFRYDRHTARIDGQRREPEIGGDGHDLTWRLARLPAGGSIKIEYACFTTADAIRGDGRNRAELRGHYPGGFPASTLTFHDVEVKEGMFANHSIIFGKVFLDRNDNRVQDPGEPGIAGVRLYLEDGTYVETDEEGKFHFEGIRPGMRVMRLDETTLDPEFEPAIVDSSHAGNPRSRFVELKYGTPHKANFRVLPREREEEVLEPFPAELEEATEEAPEEKTSGRAGEQASIEETGPRFLSPRDGDVFTSRSRINIRAAGYLQAEFDLFVNDEKIDRSRIGETVYQVNKRRVEYEYVGIPLRPGENQLRIRTRSPDQEEDRETEIMVRRSTAPVTLRMEVSPEFPTGDGRTEPEVEVRFLDEAGVPTACGSVFTVLVDQGEILTRDLRPGEAGHQVRVRDGIAQFRLSAADQAETREILILAGDLEQRQTLRFSPDLRDWIINGVVSLTGQREKRKEKEDRRDAQVRRRFGLEDRLAFFAKGRLPFDVLMTTAYDTDKRGEEGRIFQERDPLEYYPLYGDESERKYEAESRDKLFLKLEREDSHVMWGDFQTGLDQTRLSAYDRGLTGAGTVYKSAWFSGRGFFSRNDQAQVKAELRGRGVSGYYELTDQNLIENSEQVILETRDRWHPERVLETSPKRRYADYDIDYERGRILFKRPVPSLDRNLNPVYIVVNYEVDGRRAKDYNVYGARAAVHDPEHRFELGVTRIVEEAMPRDYTLDGIDATFNILPELVFKAEYAESDTVEEERDQAHLAELISEYDRARFRAWYEDTGEEFTNLSMRGGTAGLETFGLEGEFQAADNLRFRDHLYTRRNTAANTASDVLLHDNIHTVNGFDLLLGGGYVSETENREEAESEKRRSGIMRTGAGFELGTRWRLEALHHHAFEDTTFEQPTRTGGDVSYKIDSLTRAYLGGERRDSMAGGSEHNLALGLERQFNRYLNGFQEMRLEGVADGRRLASGSGLDLRWPMTPEITFDASGELSRALDTSSDTEFGLDKNDFQALALGVSYRPFQGQYTASSRYEVRDSDDQTGHLAEVGGTVKLNPDHSLFGRNIFTYTRERDPELDDGWSLDLRTGWAYRPAANDRLMALSDVEVKTENRGGAAAGRRSRRYMFSGELHYQVVAHTWLEAKYGARLVQADFANTSLFSDVKALRMQYDFNDSFYGAGGLRMLKVYEGPSHELSYGLELGYNLRADTRLAAGYNFRGFEDRDFARNDNWQRGFFIALHWKFDESILGVFRRLEKD